MAYPFFRLNESSEPSFLGLPSRKRMPWPPRITRRVSPVVRRARFETLEPRVLLSADSLIGNLSTQLVDGLDDLGDRMAELIAEPGSVFKTHVPGVMQPGDGSLDLVEIRDLLIKDLDGPGMGDVEATKIGSLDGATADLADGNVDWDEAFQVIFIDQVQGWLEDYTPNGPEAAQLLNLRIDFANFLATGLETDFENESDLAPYFDIDISNVVVSFTDSQEEVSTLNRLRVNLAQFFDVLFGFGFGAGTQIGDDRNSEPV